MGRVAVAVLEPAVAFRRGLEAALTAAGFQVENPPDLMGWVTADRERVAVVTLREPEACDLIEAVTGRGGVTVALLPEPTPDAFHHALRHGAVSAVAWVADPDTITAVVAAAANRQALLPADVVRAFARRGNPGHVPQVTGAELAWLVALSRGSTVVELANDIGYSERSMFRKLHELYERLGVANRSAAILEAERLGLLDPEDRQSARL